MWEYNHISGNARSGVLMHRDHKYIDKYRDARGNWQYVYDVAKSGASRAASAAKSAYATAKPVASRAASATASAAKSAYAKAKPAVKNAATAVKNKAAEYKPVTVKEDKILGDADARRVDPNTGKIQGKTVAQEKREAAAQKKAADAKKAAAVQKKAKADTQKGMKDLETYRKLYTMLSNGSYPMNYVDPTSGKTVTVKDRSGAAQAKANIALAANKVYQDNNKRFTMMNQKDPDIGNMAQQNERAMEMFNTVKKSYIGKETR